MNDVASENFLLVAVWKCRCYSALFQVRVIENHKWAT